MQNTGTCDILDDLGIDPVIRVDDHLAAQWEADRRARELDSFRLRSGIPARLVRQWQRDACPDIADRVRAAMDTSDLVIIEPGAGRVAAAAALLDGWDPDRGYRGLWRSSRDHVGLVMASTSRDASAERSAVRWAECVSILVLDRVGTEHDKTAAIIDRLLVTRWDAELPTIACSAIRAALWPRRYPEITAAASGEARTVGCSGESEK